LAGGVFGGVGGEIEVEVGTSFEESFFGGVTLTEGFLETFVAVVFGFEFGFLEDHVECVEVVFQFEVDCAFGGGEDNADFMLGPGDFINIRRILFLIYGCSWLYLAHELIQESLRDFMTTAVPIRSVHLAERVELFDVYN
jgi:hypothetical protein